MMRCLLRVPVVCYLFVLTFAVPVWGQTAPTAQQTGDQKDCLQAVYSSKWSNQAFAPQGGRVTVEFDVVPTVAGIRSAIILSDGPTTGTSNGPIFLLFDREPSLLRIRQTGRGSKTAAGKPINYFADKEVTYVANAKNHFRIVADIPKQIFSVYVTPAGGAEQALARDYAFEKTASPVKQLSNIGVDVQIDVPQQAGTKNAVCNLVIGATPPQ